VGAILFETLTGEALLQAGRAGDPATRVAKARLQSPTTDDDALPRPIAEILQRSLALDPAARYAEIQEMRKAVDTLLFSGDFTPTTFNLAFFMHSLFREDIERESKSLKEEKDTSYIEFLTETGPLSRASSTTLPGIPRDTVELRAPSADATVVVPPPPAPAHAPTHAPAPLPLVPPPPPLHREPLAHAPHREPAHTPPPHAHGDSSFTFHKPEPKAGQMPLILGGAAIAVVLAAVGGYFAYQKLAGGPPPAPTTTTLSAEAAAAVARVKELEEKLRTIEAEKAAAEAKAAEEARKKLEAQAAAKGQAVDPAALQRAQEEAAKKARAEQEKKAAEERKRLEEEKRAEEARLAEERRRAEEEAARIAAAAMATTLPATTTTTEPPQPAIRPGTLVNLSDPGVIAPVAERVSPPMYPEIARRQGLEGTVELNVLVDERGSVQDVQVVTGAGGKAGLNEAAADNVRKRKYRPATKEGIPVKVWVPVRVQFKLPK
jgi:TonB family protein